ncbi:MAG: hypothetical protein F4X59_15055 [Holophagales bacterium]|nr:hypothetical protein [Holophagales bacterium]MYC11431.1 hypothetical protein [Holophagales bacterium]
MSAPSRFKYPDTYTTRYGIAGIARCVEKEVVAVVGVGGSGSYLTDLLAKTNVKEVHLFDDDCLLNHNAFRLAGAASVDEIDGSTCKVLWHKQRYAAVREEGIYTYRKKVGPADPSSIRSDLEGCTMVFIAVDKPSARRNIQRTCNEMGIDHIALGIGVTVQGESKSSLGGMVCVEVACVPDGGFESDEAAALDDDAYGHVQTAELNMLSAALAIVEWKALRGFYRRDDPTTGREALYVISSGRIVTAETNGR